jgi:hypothetical protein
MISTQQIKSTNTKPISLDTYETILASPIFDLIFEYHS